MAELENKNKGYKKMITKQYLMDKAKNFDDPDDFIYWIQAELGRFDESNRTIEQYRENSESKKYGHGRDILIFIEKSNPGHGWFYIAENIWREAHDLKLKRL